MDLSRDLLKDFVRVTNQKDNSPSKIVYGTVKSVSDVEKYVVLDGSEMLTPITELVDVQDGDRVLVNVEHHMATILGNISFPPSARKEDEALDNSLDALDKAEGAGTLADQAIQKAEDANELAGIASGLAQESLENSKDALESAGVAREESLDALEQSKDAVEKAQQAVDKADETQGFLNSAQDEIDKITDEISGVKGDISETFKEMEELGKENQLLKETLEMDYTKKTELTEVEASLKTEFQAGLNNLQSTMEADYAAKTDLVEMEGHLQTQITQNAEGLSSQASKVEKLESDTEEAQKEIDRALEASAEAKTAADQAQSAADTAKQAADNAQNAADTATIKAETAQDIADEAKEVANKADLLVQSAQSDLDEAKQNLENVTNRVGATEEEIADAQKKVDEARENVNKALEDAATADAAAKNAQSAADQAQLDASTAQKAADNAKEKADAAEIIAVKAREDALAAQEEVDALKHRVVEAETKIEQNAEQILLQANKIEEVASRKIIKETKMFFYLSTSNTELVGGAWVEKAPPYEPGKYYWQKTISYYTDLTQTETSPICITMEGPSGDGFAWNILLDSDREVSNTDYLIREIKTDRALQKNTNYTIVIKAFLPTSRNLAVYFNGGLQKVCDWSGTATEHVYKAKFTSSNVDITHQSIQLYSQRPGQNTGGGESVTLFWACLYEGHQNVLDEWQPSRQDVKGEDGLPGVDGQSIESITAEYYISTSKEKPTGGSWNVTMPTWSKGKYLWIRNKIVYINPSKTKYTEPYCDSSWEAVNEIQVGGRNLALGTKEFKEENWKIHSSFTKDYDEGGFTIIKRSQPLSEVPNWERLEPKTLILAENYHKGLTVSVDVKSDKVSDLGNTCLISIQIYNKNNTRIGWVEPKINGDHARDTTISFSKPFLDNEWTRYSVYFPETALRTPNGYDETITDQEPAYTTASFQTIYGGTIYFRKAKLEYGNKATDWTPAPEDIENELHTNYYTKTETRAQIDIQSDSIISTVSKTYATIERVEGLKGVGTNVVRGTKDFSNWTFIFPDKWTSTVDENGFTILSYFKEGATAETWDRASQPGYIQRIEDTQTLTISCDIMIDDVTKVDDTRLISTQTWGPDIGNPETLYRLSWEAPSLDLTQLKNGEWTRIEYSFPAATLNRVDPAPASFGYTVDDVTVYNISLQLPKNGSVHWRKLKVEIGEKATDWLPAPEDIPTSGDVQNAQGTANDALANSEINGEQILIATSQIEQLSDSISMLVTDQNGSSLMTQTSDGWTFNIGEITTSLQNAANSIEGLEGDLDYQQMITDSLNSTIDALNRKAAYINMTTDEYGNPCIELGRYGDAFRVRISNTSVDFMEGDTKVAYVSNNTLYIERTLIKNELQIGEGQGFIWQRRDNGNLGLRWISG